jgi:FAD/FMN-containing dehydrogenase
MAVATGERELDQGAVRELSDSFRGELIWPNDSTYDQRRSVWNGSINRFPALIARCAGVADVKAALRFARQEALDIAVRGGGHS